MPGAQQTTAWGGPQHHTRARVHMRARAQIPGPGQQQTCKRVIHHAVCKAMLLPPPPTVQDDDDNNNKKHRNTTTDSWACTRTQTSEADRMEQQQQAFVLRGLHVAAVALWQATAPHTRGAKFSCTKTRKRAAARADLLDALQPLARVAETVLLSCEMRAEKGKRQHQARQSMTRGILCGDAASMSPQ